MEVNHIFLIKFLDGKFIGEGIKKIPAYICKVPYDELNELREKFWNSRKYNKRVWKAIRECCESDAETAVMLLEAAEMACVKNDLREVIVLDNPEYVFKVPNYCVCDPVFERNYDKIREENKDIEQVKIKIILFYLAKNKEIKLHVTNKTHVKKVKEAFANKMEIDLKTHKVRLLFRGQELLDDNPLFCNKVENMSKIQVMVNEL
jgi:hypothetical protein